MNRSNATKVFFGILCAISPCVFSLPVSAQSPATAEVGSLASKAAERVAKTQRQHIFVAGMKECQLDPDLCASFETSLRADLEKAIPGVHFVKRENVINILEGRGFTPIDMYIPEVIKAVATSAGADILVTDSLVWQRDGYELDAEVFDVAQRKKLEQFRARVERPVPNSEGEPLIFTDADSHVSLIIYRGKLPKSSVIHFAECEKCPDPIYTPEERASRLQGSVSVLATITEKGMAENIGVIDGLQEGVTKLAVDTLRTWHFKPAIGKDGNPIVTRVPVQIMFRSE